MNKAQPVNASVKSAAAAIIVACLFTGVLMQTLDYPLRTHADESAKIGAVISGANSSYHPVLMLQVVRAVNAWPKATRPETIARIGRMSATIAGAIAVFVTFLLARELLPRWPALCCSAAVAVSPLMTVHARYFKEDIFMLPFLLLALVGLIETLKKPTRTWAILLGAAIGLAAGAKYIGAIILPFSIAILLVAPCFRNRPDRLWFILLMTVLAGGVFLLVEWPVLWELAQAQRAVHFELAHAAHGHDVRLPISLTHGIFHLRESLLPGLGMPLAMLGLFGLTTPLWAAPERRPALLIIAAFAMLWYVLIELSPLKPFPGFARYALPLAPLLVICGAAFIYELTVGYFPRASGYLTAGLMVLAAIPAFYLSLRINGPNSDDLRASLSPTLANLRPVPYFDHYTHFMGRINSDGSTDLFVTSSFRYERFVRFGSVPSQREFARYAANYYNALFELPYLEVTNGRPSFGFFNPVIRIVALDGNSDHLKSIAVRLSRAREGSRIIRLVNESGSLRSCHYRPAHLSTSNSQKAACIGAHQARSAQMASGAESARQDPN